MKVRTRLGVAIALPVALLGGMVAWHLRGTRQAVATAHELTAVWSRVHQTAAAQGQRVAELEETAAKYQVTRDTGYLERLARHATDFAHDLESLRRMPLSGPTADAVEALGAAWHAFAPLPAELTRAGGRLTPSLGTRLTAALDTLDRRSAAVSEASFAAMLERLARASLAAREAERVAIVTAIGVLLLSSSIVLLVFRSIARPIRQLAEGTMAIGTGRFDVRLDTGRNDEFARLATEFNRMAERLGEVDRLKRDFVSTVSHDLKTPLASMRETTDLLLESVAGPLTTRQERLLRLHQDSEHRLGRMLEQLLDLSRLDGEPVPSVRPVPVEPLVTAAVTQANAGASGSTPRVTLHLPPGPLVVDCDSDRCRQVLDNLLDNALKYSPDTAPVRVEVALVHAPPRGIALQQWKRLTAAGRDRGVLLLAVSDRGPGIPDREKHQVFSRFYQRAIPTRRGPRGVGLGLAICHDIVEAHGGMIWVEDHSGGGCRFLVLLPGARHAPAEQPAMAVA